MSDRIKEIRARVPAPGSVVRVGRNTSTETLALIQNSLSDIRFLLDALATRDAEIERLKAVADAAGLTVSVIDQFETQTKTTERIPACISHSIINAMGSGDRLRAALTQWKEAQS